MDDVKTHRSRSSEAFPHACSFLELWDCDVRIDPNDSSHGCHEFHRTTIVWLLLFLDSNARSAFL